MRGCSWRADNSKAFALKAQKVLTFAVRIWNPNHGRERRRSVAKARRLAGEQFREMVNNTHAAKTQPRYVACEDPATCGSSEHGCCDNCNSMTKGVQHGKDGPESPYCPECESEFPCNCNEGE